MLLNFFTVPLILKKINVLVAQVLLKINSKRRALFIKCGGAYEGLLWYG